MSNNRLALDTAHGGRLTRDQGRYFYACPKCKLKGRPHLNYEHYGYGPMDERMLLRCGTCDFEDFVGILEL